jgi:hypothetical protein
MKKSSSVKPTKRSKPGDRDCPIVTLRVSGAFGALIAAWAADQPDNPDFAEAVCRLVKLGLAKQRVRRTRSSGQSARASALAGKELDRQQDSLASGDERSNRKKRLIDGPEEFRTSRVDRRKP